MVGVGTLVTQLLHLGVVGFEDRDGALLDVLGQLEVGREFL